MSPDGKFISFNLWNTKTGMNLYVIPVEGGAPRKLVADAAVSDWSPDGKYLAYEAVVRVEEGKPEKREVRLMDMTSNETHSVPEGVGKAGVIWAAPDKLVAFSDGIDKLVLFDLKTQKWSDLASGFFSNIVRATEGDYIYAEQIQKDASTIIKIRLSDGHIEKLLDLRGGRRLVEEYENTWFEMSPGGSVILTQDVGTKEIYSLKIRWP